MYHYTENAKKNSKSQVSDKKHLSNNIKNNCFLKTNNIQIKSSLAEGTNPFVLYKKVIPFSQPLNKERKILNRIPLVSIQNTSCIFLQRQTNQKNNNILKDKAYIDNVVDFVVIEIVGGDFWLAKENTDGTPCKLIYISRKEINSIINNKDKDEIIELYEGKVFESKKDTEKGREAFMKYGCNVCFFYKGQQNYIYPTIICNKTIPNISKKILELILWEKDNVKMIAEGWEDIFWAMMDVRGFSTGISGLGKFTKNGFAPSRLKKISIRKFAKKGFTVSELVIKEEAKKIFLDKRIQDIFNHVDKDKTIKIDGRTIQYVSDLKASGMTMFNENGFILGKEAFSSKEELAKTICHELYRLKHSTSLKTGVTKESARSETDAAADFAEKAYNFVLGKN